jgi:hypothetical protein
LREFCTESDRAAVVLGAAKLDYSLYQLLQQFLKPNEAGRDELLDGDGPLSTFSAKINLCHRLGLIHIDVARLLHLIRKIRNEFAHEVNTGTLDSSPHKDRIKQLMTPFTQSPTYSLMRDCFFKHRPGPAGDFLCILTFLVGRLDAWVALSKPISDYDIFCLQLEYIFPTVEELMIIAQEEQDSKTAR